MRRKKSSPRSGRREFRETRRPSTAVAHLWVFPSPASGRRWPSRKRGSDEGAKCVTTPPPKGSIKPVGPFIADFACLNHRLIVELDGRPHENPGQAARDRRRDAWFVENGWRVLRLSNERVIGGAALDDIARALRSPSSDPASPGHLLP
ncbi:MAG: hypothetical protein CTY30_05660 [Methylocystis sp.]|nr:MAG: hypothetical protein CTY30_05660 [Methylocystis sp.]